MLLSTAKNHQSTKAERPSVAYARDVTVISNDFSVVSTRDGTLYSGTLLSENIPLLVELLSEKGTPYFRDWEVEDVRALVKTDLANTSPEEHVEDVLHFQAYHGVGLGRPKLAPSYNVSTISDKTLHQFVSTQFTADRMTVVGLGVDHSKLAQYVATHFGAISSGSAAHTTTAYKVFTLAITNFTYILREERGWSHLLLIHTLSSLTPPLETLLR